MLNKRKRKQNRLIFSKSTYVHCTVEILLTSRKLMLAYIVKACFIDYKRMRIQFRMQSDRSWFKSQINQRALHEPHVDVASIISQYDQAFTIVASFRSKVKLSVRVVLAPEAGLSYSKTICLVLWFMIWIPTPRLHNECSHIKFSLKL